MPNNRALSSRLALSALALACGLAHADDVKGIYAVGRFGASFDPKANFDTSSASAFGNSLKYNTAPTGELGAGYNFGRFRVEQTLGYTSNDAKEFAARSRVRAYTLTVSGFADFPITPLIVPYVGGGLGAVRIDSRLSLADTALGFDREFSSKDWGPLWHVDAGLGFRATPRFTVELGARYSKTFSMKKIGSDAAAVPVSQLSSMSALLGAHYTF